MSASIAEEILGPDGRRGGIDDKGVRRYTRVFQVLCSDSFDGPIIASTAPGLPALFASYVTPSEVDLGCLVRSITPSQPEEDHPWLWHVTVEYSSEASDPGKMPGSASGGDFNLSPLLRPPEITIGQEVIQEASNEDVYGTAILNSVGKPFDPPLMFDVAIETWTITINSKKFNPEFYRPYRLALNSDKFLGFDPQEVLCRSITSQSTFDNNLNYARTTFLFWCRKIITRLDGTTRYPWRANQLDCGWDQFNGDGTKIIRIIDDLSGAGISQVALLDGNGYKLGVGEDPVFLDFSKHRLKVFKDLKLPL